LSRGINVEELKTLRIWRHGLTWLSQDPHRSIRDQARPHPQHEEKKHSLLVGSTDNGSRLMESSRCSSNWKLLRVTASVLRIVLHVKQKISMGENGCLRTNASPHILDQRGHKFHLLVHLNLTEFNATRYMLAILI
jgi:hypothetical protein